ncbi:MAG: twin-arginine translocation signal domain-containing protein, partial [Planctomycetaceae bacterium]|nr:twin-arginine translocation signal domain-containing protein [Planctomycetaceae bacterium]
MTKPSNFTRRDFLTTTTAGAAAVSSGVWTGAALAESRSANEKLVIACVG